MTRQELTNCPDYAVVQRKSDRCRYVVNHNLDERDNKTGELLGVGVTRSVMHPDGTLMQLSELIPLSMADLYEVLEKKKKAN